MKILHIVSGLQKASGVTTFVENVVEELRALGHEVDVLTKSGAECQVARANFSSTLHSYDIVHLHGLWDPWLHQIFKSARSTRSTRPRIVISPHGMLQKWALKNKWWKKLAGLALYQWWDLRRADLLHVTADSEVADVRRLALPNPLVLAPLGVRVFNAGAFGTRRIGQDLNAYAPSASQPDGISTSCPTVSDFSQRSVAEAEGSGDRAKEAQVGVAELAEAPEEVLPTPEARRTLLFVSRVQRKKGLPNLITAWSRLPEDLRTAWTIRIVGPDQDNHTAELKAQAQALGVAGDFEFAGAKYDADLAAEYASADLFVLPTHSENFGSVVIEALAHEVPVICTKAAPWAELEGDSSGNGKCGWWIDDSVDALTTCLRSALTTPPSTLAQMGARGRSLVESKYTWRAVASRLSTAYENVSK